MTCDWKILTILHFKVHVQIFTCLNCSSKVHEPPSSLDPVDCGVGGWDGLEDWFGVKEARLVIGEDPRPARNCP